MMDETLGRIHFVFTYLGFLITFFPMHIVGMLGMPRRVAVYDPAFTDFNRLISFAAFVLGFSTFIVLYNIVAQLLSWTDRRRQSLARLDPGMGHDLAAAANQLP